MQRSNQLSYGASRRRIVAETMATAPTAAPTRTAERRSGFDPLRGKPRGPVHAAGDASSLAPDRTYVVAATDYELEAYGRLIEPDWNLRVRYDFPTIIREAIEERLTERRAATVRAAAR